MPELGYDMADQKLEQAELQAKYGEQGHPVYTRSKYAEALSKHPEIEETLNGYYDWVSFMCLSDEQVSLGDEDVIEIKDINQFAAMVSHWHQNMLARLRNMRDIPHGTEVGLTTENGTKSVKLKGDAMLGFQAMLNVAIAELDQFPFIASAELDPAELAEAEKALERDTDISKPEHRATNAP